MEWRRVKRLLLFCLLTLPVWAQTDWRDLSKEVATLRQDGLYREALEVATRAVAAAEASGDIMAVGVTTNNQALLQMDLGDDFRAELGFRKALKIYIEAPRLGPDHQYTANVRKNLGLCLHHRALYPEAEQAFRKAFEVYEGLDPDHYQPETIDIMVGLANVLTRQGRHGEARPLLEEAVKKLGFGSNARVRAQQSLAQLLEAVGETQRAEELFGEAVRFYETDPEPDVRILSRAMRMQAGLYLNRMEYGRAEAIYRRALELFRQAAPDDPELANPLNDMGLLYRQIGDIEQAVTYFRQANEIHERSLGPNHPLTCTSLTNLAQAYSGLGRHVEAEKLLREALSRTRATVGLDPVETAEALSNLAVELLETNQGKEAATLLEEAVPLFVAEQARATAEGNLASAYQQIGEYAKARAHFEQALAKGDSETRAVTYNNLAYLAIDEGDRESAKQFALKADQALFARLQEVFSFTSERQRLAFREKLVPYGLLASLEQPEELLQTALRFKGVVLDSIAEDHRLAQAASDPEAQALLTMLKRLKQAMLGERSDEEKQRLQQQFDQAQAQLARLVGAPRSRAAFTVTPDQVRQALPEDTALVEFLYHGYYFGKNRSEKRYGALVVTREATRWVELGEARQVETVIRGYRQRMQMGGRSSRATRPSLAQAPEAGELRTAYDTLWAPVEKALPSNLKRLYVSPDGDLNFVSFATLLDPDQHFVADRYDLTYVSSGRDLLETPAHKESEAAFLLGAPDYRRPGTTRAAGSHAISLAPLPGSQAECQALQKLVDQARLVLDQQAREEVVSGLHSPRVLHFATHGFFLSSRYGENPMARSGLALAGAESTLDDWQNGVFPAPESDGVLTAQEVSTLDLEGTRVVVLSACDTGLGEARKGEGVLGLRRGFLQSGCDNLVFTLWPVADVETSEIMLDFYRSLNDKDPAEALNQVQRQWLTKLRQQHGPSIAAALAGPFVVTRGR